MVAIKPLRPALSRALAVNRPAAAANRAVERFDGFAFATADVLFGAASLGAEQDALGLGPDDAAKALAFALGHFAVTETKDFSLTSLMRDFRAQIAETMQRIAQLRGASRAGKFQVAFQPIVALGSLMLHHHEMLARFEPDASPAAMIHFAERIGMIEEIDLAMCRRAI